MSLPPEITTPLPWHETCWQTLRQVRAAGRLPHALLVTGPLGVGKRRLVRSLAGSLLCARCDASGLVCGHCRECELFAAGTHPDYLEIGPDPESKSDEIKVDAIRRLSASDALTAHRGGYKVIVLDPAQNMNPNAANSLLKTLEEPSPGTFLCLICEQPGCLPATIRSRCQELRVPLSATPQALEWLRHHTGFEDAETLLRLAYGAPLRALALLEEDRLPRRMRICTGCIEVAQGCRDPIAEAAVWNEQEPAVILDWLIGWVSDLLRLASGHPTPSLINRDQQEELRRMAARIEPWAGHRYLMQLIEARAEGQDAVNRLLWYESLVMQWAQLFQPYRSTLQNPASAHHGP